MNNLTCAAHSAHWTLAEYDIVPSAQFNEWAEQNSVVAKLELIVDESPCKQNFFPRKHLRMVFEFETESDAVLYRLTFAT